MPLHSTKKGRGCNSKPDLQKKITDMWDQGN